MRVRDVMTTDVATVTPETELGDVATLLVRKYISGVRLSKAGGRSPSPRDCTGGTDHEDQRDRTEADPRLRRRPQDLSLGCRLDRRAAGLDLVVPHGQFLAVMGPSGSGKTTLLNCVSGLDEIDAGRVLVDGLSIHELSDKERTKHRAREMGFIFQAFNLIPVFTATENVELPLLLAGVRERDARVRARETLTRVGLGHRLDRRPMELSGGEQQRVAVARALAGKPRIVWADEPTGNLDSEMASAVIDLLGELHREGLTIILVTHDPTVAAHADRLITVRDGRLVEDKLLIGSAEEVPEVAMA